MLIRTRQHAKGAIVLDEAHATHIGSEIQHYGGTTHSGLTCLLVLQVQLQVFHVWETLIPFIQRFDIHGTDLLVTLTRQVPYQVSSNEAAAAAYYNQLIQICIHTVLILK